MRKTELLDKERGSGQDWGYIMGSRFRKGFANSSGTHHHRNGRRNQPFGWRRVGFDFVESFESGLRQSLFSS